MAFRFRLPSVAPTVFRRALLLASIAALPSCGDDEKTAAIPLKDPTLRITGLTPVGGLPVLRETLSAGAPVELGHDGDRTIVVGLAADANWTMEPPFGCEGPRCGFVLLTVEPQGDDAGVALEIPAAGRNIPAPMRSFAPLVPFQVRFRVELRDALGHVVKDDEGGIFSDEITVEVVASSGDAGGVPDGSADAAGGGDGGNRDAALPDGAPPDGPPRDGAVRDGGPADGSVDASDTGTPEASPPEASSPDAPADGATPEAGAPDVADAGGG